MRPDEFWSLTPAEIYDLSEGYQDRMDDTMQILAWHAANIMNVHLKKKVTPKKLLGNEKRTMTETERKLEFEKLQAILKRGGR